MHASHEVQSFIQNEVTRPCKNWVHDVIYNKREVDAVKLRTEKFVLLPDTNAHRRQYKVQCKIPVNSSEDRLMLPKWAEANYKQERVTTCSVWRDTFFHAADTNHRAFNWLAIVSDTAIRSMRDLRGEHIKMLEELHDSCMDVIFKETGIESHKVMCYVNYPPSVYRLHVHFCAPFNFSSAFDAFRMHSLSSIINNLKINPEYYAISELRIPLHANSDMYQALTNCKL